MPNEENKDNGQAPEVNGENKQTPENTGEGEFKISKEDWEKTQQTLNNYQTAMQEEREKRKQAEEIVNQANKQKEKEKQEELKKAGKYEEIIAQKDKELEELRAYKEKADPVLNQYQESMTNQQKEAFEKLPENVRETVEIAIEGKSHDQAMKIINTFIETTKKPDFGGEPGNNGKNNGGKNADEIELDEAKKGGFDKFFGTILANSSKN